ncbi:MAG: SCO1664 family protein [Streptosporangiaceae bacterium]
MLDDAGPNYPLRSGPDAGHAEQAALDLLASGTLEVEGRLVDASNATLYCTITVPGPALRSGKNPGRPAKNAKSAKNAGSAPAAETRIACVYKPIAGERPLWDFPVGTLAGREVAAYIVSRAAGWDVVPPTVMRDGPFGPGMCQLWIDHDADVDLIALSRRTDHAGLRDMAVFDAVVNNADRKIGHLLPVADGHLYGCDHGVCFAEDYKLRTVLWQWRGKSLPRRSVEALRRLNAQLTDGSLAAELSPLLASSEISATRIRIETLLKHRVHPYPPADWPAVPWPPI